MAISEDFWRNLGDDDVALQKVAAQVSEYSPRFNFPEISKTSKSLFAEFVVSKLHSEIANVELCLKSLELVRILSRDSSDISALFTAELQTDLAIIIGYSSQTTETISSDLLTDAKVKIECQKCFCNALYHGDALRTKFINDNCLSGLCSRLDKYGTDDYKSTAADSDYFLRLYDMRILFLVTARCPGTREKCFKELNTLQSLVTLYERLAHSLLSGGAANEQISSLIAECLKALFNITIDVKRKQILLQEHVKCCERIVVTGSAVLTAVQCHDGELVSFDLQNHVVNALTVLPTYTYDKLAPPSQPTAGKKNRNRRPVYQSRDMTAIDVLLSILSTKLNQCSPENAEESSSTPVEELSPIISLLADIARSSDLYRKYLKFKILPPLESSDVHRRPEEGTTLRNRLCKLMTSSANVQALAADLLYELCQRSVSRLVKYTGFGNAAGLLANYGLLGKVAAPVTEDTDGADADDETDTDEYMSVRDQINPVVGCVTPPKTESATAHMSEEQKEYEAMKLVEQINKLIDQGIVKPGTIGEDGKVKPVSHILELTKNIPDPETEEDSD